jgi:hypothetical protein
LKFAGRTPSRALSPLTQEGWLRSARATSSRTLALGIALLALLLLPVVAFLRTALGNTTPFEYSLRISPQTPLSDFAPSAANTQLSVVETGWWETFAALPIFAGELTQSLTGRGLLWIVLLALIGATLWYVVARVGGWRKPSIALILLLALQLCGAAYYFSSFRAPSRTLNTAFTAFDFHTHTTHSAGLLTPQQQIDWHRRRGFKGLAFTDTNRLMEPAEFAALQRSNPDMLLLNGSEYQSGNAHLIFLGLRTAVDGRRMPNVEQAVRTAKSQGAIVIVAHPWSPGKHSLEEFRRMGVHGFEGWNGVVWDRRVTLLNQNQNLISVGSTDDLSKSGARCHVWTLLPAGIDDSEDVLRALRMRKTAVAFALDDSNTPEAYNQNRRASRRPQALAGAMSVAWNSLTRAQQVAALLGMIACLSTSWAWGLAPARPETTLAGPQRAVGFLRRRRLVLRSVAALIVVLAFAGSLAAAYFAMADMHRCPSCTSHRCTRSACG